MTIRKAVVLLLLPAMLCGRSPSVDIIGSFLPAWMICVASAILLTFAARYALVRTRMETEVSPLALFYPGMVVLFSCTMWLLFYR